MTPTEHDRFDFYPRELRKESWWYLLVKTNEFLHQEKCDITTFEDASG
jgi:hypothetical protein